MKNKNYFNAFADNKKYWLMIVLLIAGMMNTNATTYYSQTGGSFDIGASLFIWNTSRTGGGTTPVNYTTPGDVFVIQGSGNGGTTPHALVNITNTWTVGAASSGNTLQIESGASLTSTAAVSIFTGSTFQVDNGGTYFHNNATLAASATIFGGTEVFGATSTVEIANWVVTSPPAVNAGVSAPFGNLKINLPSGYATAWNQAWSTTFTLCTGTFTVLSTGTTGAFRFTGTGAFNITVGNYVQSGGTVVISQGSPSPANVATLNITGSYTQSGGIFLEVNGTGTPVVNVGNGFTMSGGTFNILNGASNTGGASFNVTGNCTVSGSTTALALVAGNGTGANNATFSVTGTTTLNTTGTAGIIMQTSGAAGTAIGIFQTQDLTVPSTGTSTSLVDFGAPTTPNVNEFRIKGNFTKAGTGTFYTSSANPGGGFVFNGTGTLALPQTLSYAGTTSDYTSYSINSGTVVKQLTSLTLSNLTGPVSTFTVKNGGTLDCSTFKISCAGANGTFTLSSGATLVSANTSGIYSTTVGSISANLTTSFNAAANYIFNGTSAQNTNFKSAGQNMTNLTINNAAGVTLNGDATVTGALTVTTGTFTIGADLTINNTASIVNNGAVSISSTFMMDCKNIQMTGTGALTVNGTFRTSKTEGFSGTANTAVANTITINALPATSTVDYSKTTSQTITAGNYGNLTNSGNGPRILPAAVTIGIAGVSSDPGAGLYTINTSTIDFNGTTNMTIIPPTVASGPNYYNLTISGAAVFQLGGNTTVGGDYTQSGGSQVRVSYTASSTRTLTINGNLNLSGAAATTLRVSQVATATGIVNVAGNLNISGVGRINLAVNPLTSPASAVVNVTGNFISTGTSVASAGGGGGVVDFGDGAVANNAIKIMGNFNKSGTGTFGTSSLTDVAIGFLFNGTGTQALPQTLTYSGATSNKTNYAVNSNTTVKLLSGLTLGTSSIIQVFATASLPGVLDFDTWTVSGTSSSGFYTDVNSTLITANPIGIYFGTTSSISTAIPSGVIGLNPGTNYIFNGASAQNTRFKSSPQQVQNLTLNNSNNVTMTEGITISGVLTFTSGKLIDPSPYQVTFNSSATTSGAGPGKFITGTGTIRTDVALGNTTKLIPVGDALYAGVNITFTGSGATVSGNIITTVAATDANEGANLSGINQSQKVNRYWFLTGTPAALGTYDITLNFESGNVLGGANTGNFVIRKFSSGAWATTTLAGGGALATSTKATGLTNFSEFEVGEANPDPTVSAPSPATQTFCTGGSASFSVTASGSPAVTYQWRKGTTNLSNGGASNISGVTTANLTIGSVQTGDAGTDYNCVVSNINNPTVISANSTLVVNQPATANSGTVVSTCSNSGAVNITAGSTASNNSGVTWSTPDGTGSFANANSLTTATYTPSGADITAGSITITLTASGNSPCADATSSKTLTITAAPSASAGTAVSTCENSGAVNITAGSTASNNSGVTWSTPDGTGSFANANSLTTATYTPSGADITAGSVTITLTAGGNSPCADATSSKTLTITAAPSASAGTAVSTCENSGAVNITAGSTASNNSGVTWSTPDGTGSFANANSLTTATYTPSGADITAGSVTITLTAGGNSPCADATSSKTLTITAAPSASAGTALSTCENSGAVNITAGSTASNNSGVTWSTPDGTGSFANANSLTTATYTPSGADITAGSVTITLTAGGNSPCADATSSKTLTITAAPSASAGTAVSTCENSGAVNITAGSTASNNSGVTWSTPDGTGSFANANSLTTATYTPSGADITAGSITITLTASGNSPCADATSSKTLTITAAPSANISGNSTICLGSPATVNLTFTGTGPWSYTISDGSQTVSGSSSTSSTSVNITPITAGTHNYAITVVSDANCTGSGSGTAIVNVSSAPPTSSSSGIVAPGEACVGDVVLISVNVINGQNIRYSWNTGGNSSLVKFSTSSGGPFTNGPFETTTNSVYAQFGALGASSGYSICVQGVNACGSTNNNCKWVRGTVSTPGAITGSVVACSGNTKSYSCGASTGASTYNWTFSVAGATITGQGTPNVSVTFPTFTSGSLCVTAALSCGGSSTSAARCISISNNPALPAPIVGSAKVCPGTTGVSYSVPAVAGASGYNWTVPAGTTIASGTNTNAITVNFPNPYTITANLCVTATSPCGSSPARCKSVGSSVPSQPGAINGPTSNVCGSSVQYSIASVSGATSYTWTIPAGSSGLIGQGTNSIQFTAPSSGTSGVVSVVANTTACSPGTSAARTLTINYKPATPGTITANPATWCAGASVNFSVVAAAPLPTYSWTVTNGTIDAGQFSNNIDVTWGTGAGNVSLVANNNCGNSGVKTQSFSSSCREEENELTANGLEFMVYPNPAHDKLTVSIDAKGEANYTIKLIDIAGRVILAETKFIQAGINNFEISLEHFSKGIYTLEVQSQMINRKTKVVIE